jgi:hypothetical protein
MMNHTSDKSKWKSWHRGTGCDEESHVSKCQSILNSDLKIKSGN